MIIKPFLIPKQHLFLDAYSYQRREIESVAFVLQQIASFEKQSLDDDAYGRMGLRHVIQAPCANHLEKHLGIVFRGEGESTTMVFQSLGKGFRCRQICPREAATGCVTLGGQ